MSKFQPIQTNRFGAVQHRSLKQILEQHKQEIERMKEPKSEPLCVEQYINPYKSDHCNNPAMVCVTEEPTMQSDDECRFIQEEEKSNDDLPLHDHPHVHIEMPVIYDNNVKAKDEVKDVEVQTEVENIRSEFKRKQSLKDVVKLSYKHFLNKEFSGSV